DGPIALRYPRGEGVGVPLPDAPSALEIGTGEILREGERVALLGYGTGVGKALEAASLLAERGISATVADARFAKPIDAGLAAQPGPRQPKTPLSACHRKTPSLRHGKFGRIIRPAPKRTTRRVAGRSRRRDCVGSLGVSLR